VAPHAADLVCAGSCRTRTWTSSTRWSTASDAPAADSDQEAAIDPFIALRILQLLC
jgi:hypothetical protein